MNKKVFLLGIGCQKGGTTWLSRYLDRHPNFDIGFMKEYHLFDGLFLPEMRGRKAQIMNHAKEQLRKMGGGERADWRALRRAEFYARPDSYFEYFHTLSNADPDIRGVCDITPSYAVLPARRLAYIKKKLVDYGFCVRVIFFLRDPVERVISVTKQSQKQKRLSAKNLETSLEQDVLRMYSSESCAMRTDYLSTLTNVWKVFSKKEVLVDLFENIFDEDRVERITRFLGISYIDPQLEKSVKKTFSDEVVSETTKDRIASFFRSQYEYVEKEFPELNTAEKWRSV